MRHRHKFLVISDVPDNRFIFVRTLLRKFPDALIEECQLSTTAIGALQANVPSVILAHRSSDIDLGHLIPLLRHVSASVPIIAITGRNNPIEIAQLGANAVLTSDAWQVLDELVDEVLLKPEQPLRTGGTALD